jgi:hypothetical protein
MNDLRLCRGCFKRHAAASFVGPRCAQCAGFMAKVVSKVDVEFVDPKTGKMRHFKATARNRRPKRVNVKGLEAFGVRTTKSERA